MFKKLILCGMAAATALVGMIGMATHVAAATNPNPCAITADDPWVWDKPDSCNFQGHSPSQPASGNYTPTGTFAGTGTVGVVQPTQVVTSVDCDDHFDPECWVALAQGKPLPESSVDCDDHFDPVCWTLLSPYRHAGFRSA